MTMLIRDARVIDGAGAPWFLADVRLEAGRIAAIGSGLASTDAEIVEAGGRYLAPGFIDAHCHDDLICLREPGRAEKILQGVTTIVTGNCSFSLYPATQSSAEALRLHFSGIAGETEPAEIFETLTGYRAALHDRGIALNVVSLVGHAALRLAVGAAGNRAATASERSAMQALLARELAAGAAGLSLGLVYPPSAYADEAELIALAETVKAHGKLLAAHIRSYEGGLLASTDEFLAILRASGAAGLLSHLQSAGKPHWGNVPRAISRLEAARTEGIDVSFDMYPYLAGSSYALQLFPPAALADGLDALRARLCDPAGREALRRAVEEAPEAKVALIGWHNIRIAGTGNEALKQFQGFSVPEAAARASLSPFDLFARLIDEDRGQTSIVMFQLDEADLHAACTHPLHMVGSDGLPRPGTRPHPRAFGTFPRVAGRLRREAKWFPLEDAIRRMTSAPAQRFALADRGLIRPGMVADLVLFEDGIDDRATFDDPVRYPAGIADVWVAGRRVVADGCATAERPGRLLGTGQV